MEQVGTIVITALLATVIFGVVVWVLGQVRTPHYQLRTGMVIDFLEQVLAGSATETDWHIFTELPIRHDERLERVRQRCIQLEAQHWRGGDRLLDREGRAALSDVLERLKTEWKLEQSRR